MGTRVLACLAQQIAYDGVGPTPLGLTLRDVRALATTCTATARLLAPELRALNEHTGDASIGALMALLQPGGASAGSPSSARVLGDAWLGPRVDQVCNRLRTHAPQADATEIRAASTVRELTTHFLNAIGVLPGAPVTQNAFSHLPMASRVRVVEALCHRIPPWVEAYVARTADADSAAGRRAYVTKRLCNVTTALIASIPDADRTPFLNALWLLGVNPDIPGYRVVDGHLDAASCRQHAIELARLCRRSAQDTGAILKRHPPLDKEARVVFINALADHAKAAGFPDAWLAKSMEPHGVSAVEALQARRKGRSLQIHSAPRTATAPNAVALTLIHDPRMEDPATRHAYLAAQGLSVSERDEMAHLLVKHLYEVGMFSSREQVLRRYGLTAIQYGYAMNKIMGALPIQQEFVDHELEPPTLSAVLQARVARNTLPQQP